LGGGVADFDLNVKVASKRFNCPGEKITETDGMVTFADIMTTGDCLGDGIRTDGKDPSKYTIAKNSDGTLTFNSDGYPALKMKSKAKLTGSTCSLYEIADGSCGQSDLDCSYTKYAKAAEKALQDGTCADQGYTTKTGTQTKSYPVIGDIVISTYSKPALQVSETLSGAYEGSVPFIIDVNADFLGGGVADFDLNVKVASKRFNCPGEKITETDGMVTFADIMTTGDCLGDGIRTDGKDPSKYTIAKNSDGTLTFNSDGYPALKMKSKSMDVLV